MIIARILGTVVSSQKDERLLGKKLRIVRPINVDGSDTTGYVVAVYTVGAGFHERVLVVAGSSALRSQALTATPVDAALVGVIDPVDIAAPEWSPVQCPMSKVRSCNPRPLGETPWH